MTRGVQEFFSIVTINPLWLLLTLSPPISLFLLHGDPGHHSLNTSLLGEGGDG